MFVWDEAKRESNLKKHGLDIEMPISSTRTRRNAPTSQEQGNC